MEALSIYGCTHSHTIVYTYVYDGKKHAHAHTSHTSHTYVMKAFSSTATTTHNTQLHNPQQHFNTHAHARMHHRLAKKCADRDVKNITKRNKIEYITQIMNLYAQPSPTAAVSTTTTTSNPDVKTSAAETAADGADDEKAAEVEEEGKQND